MIIKYNINVENLAIEENFKRLINQIYKLLPLREEEVNWEKPLLTIIEELAGMDRLLVDQHEFYFCLLCKLEGLFTLTNEEDFMSFRRTIFECLNLLSEIKKKCLD